MADMGCVILAGGLGRRIGGDKALVTFEGRPLVAHVLERVAAQMASVVINANGDPARFREFDVPVIADTVPGFPGPLAGVLAGLDHFVRLGVPLVLAVPCDAPRLPPDLAARLAAGCADEAMEGAVAVSGGRRHPAVALWRSSLAADLRHALVEEDLRRVDTVQRRHGFVEVDWGDVAPDPFVNVNSRDDLASLK